MLEIVPIITEYRIYADERGKFKIPAIFQNEVVYGDAIRTMAVMLYSEGVMSNDRICDFIKSIGEDIYPLSTGTVYNFINRFSRGIDCELKDKFNRNHKKKTPVCFSECEYNNLKRAPYYMTASLLG